MSLYNISTRQAKILLHGKKKASLLCSLYSLDRGDRMSSPMVVSYRFPLYVKFIVAKMPLTSSTTSETCMYMMAMLVVSTVIRVLTFVTTYNFVLYNTNEDSKNSSSIDKILLCWPKHWKTLEKSLEVYLNWNRVRLLWIA